MNIQDTHFAKIEIVNFKKCNKILKNTVVNTTIVVVMRSKSIKNRLKYTYFNRLNFEFILKKVISILFYR